MSRVFLDEVAQNLVGGICRRREIRRQPNSPALMPKQTTPNETSHQPFKDGAHRCRHVQGRCLKGSIWSHSHFPQPATQLRSGQIVNGAKRCLNFGGTANGDDTVEGALGRSP